MMLSILPLALAPLSTPLQADLAGARRTAFEAWSQDRVGEALNGLAEAIREGARELSALPDGDAAHALACELEFSVIRLQDFASATRNRPFLETILEDVQVDPRHGDLFARLAWMRDDALEELAPLWRWEFVGPFDNERGSGMESPLEPQDSPASSATYTGKVREVAWRTTPDFPPRSGVVRSSHLLDPTWQVCMLARSWIRSDVARDALLYVGFDEEARIWLDGRVVFEELGQHDFSQDSFVVPVTLNEGWNELAILVGGREASPAFVMRLAERETSKPLALEQRATAPDGVEPLRLESATDELARTEPGIRGRVAGDESAEGWFRRSVLERTFRTLPRAAHPGRQAAARAVELQRDDARFLVQYALTLDEAGTSAEKDVNPWLHAIDELLAVAPEQVWALRQRAYHAGWNQPTFERALRTVERALAANPTSVRSLQMKAVLLDRLSRDAEATLVRRRLVELPEIELFPAVRMDAASVLSRRDPRVREIARAGFEADGDLDALSIWSWHARRGGGPVSAEDLEQVAHMRLERAPWSVTARAEVAGELLSIDEPARALRWLDEALALAPERAYLHRWRARALLAMDDVEGATAALERHLELDFSAEDERRLLDHLRSMGAEPFHVAYQEPLEDILRRVQVDQRLAETLPSREVVYSQLVVKVNPDGTAKRYHRMVQRILSERGARDLDRIPFRSAGNQEVRVMKVDVLTPSGQVKQAETGRSTRGMIVDLPPLDTGDVVDLEWRVDDLSTTFFGNYFALNRGFAPDPTVPTYQSEIVLRVPAGFPIEVHSKGVSAPSVVRAEDGTTEYRWELSAIAPIEIERFMPPPEEHLPSVQASSYASWADFGAWWWNLIEEEIRVSPEMAAKVRELVAGKEAPLEKLRAVYDFVVTDIRYNAWEFGVHGYQPYSAPVIFSRGFGDCKDKAILMRALLSELGIEAWPVLIRAEDRRLDEDQTLAMVEHFNHCIAYVPEQEGIPEMFLDGTARHHPLEVLPAMDNGARVLIVRADGVEERQIPFAPADVNRLETTHDIALQEGLGARVRLTRRSFGRYDPADRNRFGGSPDEREEEASRALSGLFGPVKGEVTVTVTDVEDLETPVELTIEGTVEQVAIETDSGFELPAAISKLELLRSLASESERETDVLLDVPRSSETTIHYTLPAGATAVEPPPPPVEVETEDARFTWSAERTDTGWTVREHFELKTHRIPAARYDEFRDFARIVDETQQATLEVEVRP